MGAKSYLLTAFILTIVETIAAVLAVIYLWLARDTIQANNNSLNFYFIKNPFSHVYKSNQLNYRVTHLVSENFPLT